MLFTAWLPLHHPATPTPRWHQHRASFTTVPPLYTSPRTHVHCNRSVRRIAAASREPDASQRPEWADSWWAALLPRLVFGVVNLPLLVLRTLLGVPLFIGTLVFRCVWQAVLYVFHRACCHSNTPVWAAQAGAFLQEAVTYLPRFTGPSWKVCCWCAHNTASTNTPRMYCGRVCLY